MTGNEDMRGNIPLDLLAVVFGYMAVLPKTLSFYEVRLNSEKSLKNLLSDYGICICQLFKLTIENLC